MAETKSTGESRGAVRFTVNGAPRVVDRDPSRSLLTVLREELGLTGTKYGCGEGECGACTVLLEGRPTRACRLTVAEVRGRSVTTIEGIAVDGELSSVQRAFADTGAYQCGFCTPGMIMAATALLRAMPEPTESDIRDALEGHLCRCCGYARILAAVHEAVTRSPTGGQP